MRRVRGVKGVWVDGCAGELTVVRRQGTASNNQLLGALKRCGHRGRVLPISETTLQLKGVRDNASRRKVERALKKVSGVRTVSLKTGSCAKVSFDSSRLRPAHLVLAIRKAGYDAVIEKKPATRSL